METEFIQLEKWEPTIRRVLREGGNFRFYPRGTSMKPFIIAGKDMVVLSPLPDRVEKYRIILYKRDNGAFVLHRVIRINGDKYTMRGDNQFMSEPGIRRDQMIGMVTEIERGGRTRNPNGARLLAAAALWVWSALPRRVFRRLVSAISR